MKICVIGAGGWGKNHINTLNKLNALYGIVDSNKGLLESYTDINKDCKLFSSLEETFSESFDGYVIATPAETHYSIANQLLNEVKNLLVEKPVCLKYSEAKKLYNMALEKKCFIMGGHLLLFHPAFIKMNELVKSNKIGKILYLYSNRLNFGKVRNHENAMWSLAPHDISLLLFFVNTLPKKISYNGFKLLGRDIEDSSISSFNFPDDIGAHIFVSWLHPFKEHRFVIVGDKGMLSYEDSSKKKEILFYDKVVNHDQLMSLSDKGSTKIDYETDFPLNAQLEFFIKSLYEKSTDLNNFKLSMDVVNILENLKAGP